MNLNEKVSFILNQLHTNKTDICVALCDLAQFVQFKKRKTSHGEVLLLVKLQALQLY